MFASLHNRFGLVAITLALCCTAANAAQLADFPDDAGERPVVRIGLLTDGGLPGDASSYLLQTRLRLISLLRKDIASLTGQEFDVRFPESKRVDGRWDPARIRDGLDRLLADPEVDLIITFGALGTAAAINRPAFPKPVIAPFVVDRESQRAPFDGTASGVPNLSYVTLPLSLQQQIRRFREIVGFERVHIIFDRLILEVAPEVVERTVQLARELGAEAVAVPAAESPGEALADLPGDAQAVLVMPMFRMGVPQMQELIRGINQRGLPSMSYWGTGLVREGLLLALVEETNFERLARRIALNVQRTLLGEDPGTLPVLLEQQDRLTINMATARQIGWYPKWPVLIEADLLNEELEAADITWTLEGVALEAVRVNLDVEAAQSDLAAGEGEVAGARALLKPQLEGSVLGLVIDEDRAQASFGRQAEQTISGRLSLEQILYSDPARANVKINQYLQEARKQSYDELRLDLALQATTALLDVLRAETLVRIDRQNVRLTEDNLRVAQRRQSLGVTGPAEVYRWESQLATDRRNAIASAQRVDIARAVLNRLIHRPQEQRFKAEIPDLLSPDLVTGQGRLQPYIDNPWAFERFREFMVKEGMLNAPELKGLDAAIAAQARSLKAAKRSFWAPDVGLFADVTDRWHESGAGAEYDPGVPGLFPPDDTDWNIGVQVSLPLFTGGYRGAEVRRNTESISSLRYQKDSAAEKVELRIRTSLFQIASSSTAIELSASSAEAARRTLDLVSDSYARGVVSIIDLLDAQRNAVVAEQVAANAVYDFLIDLMEVQRAAVNFDFFRSRQDREEWFQRLDRFFEATEEQERR
jgi:outer membrane protein TolC/ABC-type uncharacterized transport system substrate-binding protein